MAAPISRSSAAASVLTESLTITGRVAGDGDLEVRGHLEGEVDLRGELTLAQGSTVRANVAATRVVVRGALVGDTRATESIVLEATARVVGDLAAPRITIALGAQIRGTLDMGGESGAEAATAARPAARPAVPTPVAKPAAPPARPMAQKGPPPPAKSVVVTRKAPPKEATEADKPAAATAEKAEPARKEPPPPVVPVIKKGQKAQPKRKQGETK